MSQVLHTLEERFTGLFGERRRAKRRRAACAVRLPVGVSMEHEQLDPHAGHYPDPIMGRTQDVSETGLSLVLPKLHLGAARIDAEAYPLRIVLCLPGGIVIVHAVTVRCAPFVAEEGVDCFIVGAQIIHMSDSDQRSYNKPVA